MEEFSFLEKSCPGYVSVQYILWKATLFNLKLEYYSDSTQNEIIEIHPGSADLFSAPMYRDEPPIWRGLSD